MLSPTPDLSDPTVSDPNASSNVERYLKKARQSWGEDEPIPDGDRLRSIAESLDMTAADSEACDRRARELTRRAQQLFEDGDDDTAESLLRDAVLLSPVRLQPHYLLAELYARRYGDAGHRRLRRQALEFAERAQELSPTHEPTRNVIEKLGETPQDGLPWKKAALIVFVIVVISGSLQLCHRYFVTPEVTDDQLEEVREHLEEQGPPPR